MATMTFPFICLPDAAIWKPGLSAHAKTLFAALLSYRNRKTGQCNPNLSKLAERLGKSLSTIRRALDQLRRAGVVIVRRTLFGNHYEIATPDRWQTTISVTDCALTDGRCAALTDERTQRSRVSAQEPDVLEPKEARAAAAGFVHTPVAAAAAPPPPRVTPKPNAPASPPADPWNGPSEAPQPQPAAQNQPAVPEHIHALAQAMARELLKVHPEPGLPRRAAPEIERVLRATSSVEDTAERIWNNYAAWTEYWKTLEAHRFIPQLWRWFAEGEWENPPVRRKPMSRGDLQAERIVASLKEDAERKTARYGTC